MTQKSFLILRTSTFLNLDGDDRQPSEIFTRHWSLVRFLDENGLLANKLESKVSQVDENSASVSADLTSLGLDVMRKGLDRWLSKQDRGGDYSDVSILKKTLEKLKQD